MREKGKWIYLLFLFMAAAMFLQASPPVLAAGETSSCSLTFIDRAKSRKIVYEEIQVTPEMYEYGERITIVDKGVTRNFRFVYGDFFDSSWKNPGDYGYAISYDWKENYDDIEMGTEEGLGKIYSYYYLLVKGDEYGNPVAAQGNITKNRSDFIVYARSDLFDLESICAYKSVTINDVVYYVYEGQNTAMAVRVTKKKEKTIKSVKIKKSVKIGGKTYPVTVIGGSCFNGCSKLSSVTLPDSIKEISDSAFVNTALKSVIIPDSVEEISSHAFGFTVGKFDEKNKTVEIKKVPGFVMYAKGDSAASQYCDVYGIKLIDEKAAKKIRVNMTAKALAHKKVRLQWKKTKYVSGFEVYKLNKKTGKYKKAATIKNGSAVSWTSKTLSGEKKGSKVRYKVRAYTRVGNSTVYGKWSKVKSVRIK